MPVFQFKAITQDGKVSEGKIEAANYDAVIAHLKEKDFLPISAVECSTQKKPSQALLFRRSGIDQSQLTILTQELARLISSGISLEKSLDIMISITESEAVKALLIRLLEAIRSGSSFAEALESESNIFDRLYISLVRAGEAGGALDVVLNRLADYMERSRELKADVSSALIYPAILLTVAVVSLILLLTLVVPQFEQMFSEVGAELPAATQVVIGLADWLQQYWWTLLLLLLLALLTIPKILALPGPRRVWDGFLVSMPVLGPIIIKVEVARFCRTFSILLKNGVVVLSALSIVKETLSNVVLKASVGDIAKSLKAGETLSTPMLETDLFPKLAGHMVKVGEETGRLDEMLMEVADIYDKEIKAGLKKMLSLLEPLLILTLGVLIAGIIFSILIALLSINDLAF